jgi:hypothetical protein
MVPLSQNTKLCLTSNHSSPGIARGFFYWRGIARANRLTVPAAANWPVFFASYVENHREHDMSLRYWLFVAVTGGLAHLVLFLADREIDAGVDRLSEAKDLHSYALDADPDLKLVNERSPNMRSER